MIKIEQVNGADNAISFDVKSRKQAFGFVSQSFLHAIRNEKCVFKLAGADNVTFLCFVAEKAEENYRKTFFSGAVFHAEYDYANYYTDRISFKSLISMQNHAQVYRVKSSF